MLKKLRKATRVDQLKNIVFFPKKEEKEEEESRPYSLASLPMALSRVQKRQPQASVRAGSPASASLDALAPAATCCLFTPLQQRANEQNPLKSFFFFLVMKSPYFPGVKSPINCSCSRDPSTGHTFLPEHRPRAPRHSCGSDGQPIGRSLGTQIMKIFSCIKSFIKMLVASSCRTDAAT